jgi:hypothetical protein
LFFIHFCMPETKGLGLAEIQTALAHSSSAWRSSSR